MLKIFFMLKLHVIAANLALLSLFAVLVGVKARSSPSLTRIFPLLALLLLTVSAVVGGYWYVTYYPGVKKAILAGDYVWTHKFFMETKEHIFFQIYALAIFIVILAFSGSENPDVRKLLWGSLWLIIAFIVLINIFGHMVSIGGSISLLYGLHGGA